MIQNSELERIIDCEKTIEKLLDIYRSLEKQLRIFEAKNEKGDVFDWSPDKTLRAEMELIYEKLNTLNQLYYPEQIVEKLVIPEPVVMEVVTIKCENRLFSEYSLGGEGIPYGNLTDWGFQSVINYLEDYKIAIHNIHASYLRVQRGNGCIATLYRSEQKLSFQLTPKKSLHIKPSKRIWVFHLLSALAALSAKNKESLFSIDEILIEIDRVFKGETYSQKSNAQKITFLPLSTNLALRRSLKEINSLLIKEKTPSKNSLKNKMLNKYRFRLSVDKFYLR